MAIEVHHTTDAAEACATAGDFLRRRPVEHNVHLTILDARTAAPLPGHYWWAVHHGDIAGYASVSPPERFVGITPVPRAVTAALVDAIAPVVPGARGVVGEAGTAAAFAGAWAARMHVAARPARAQRLYRLARLAPPSGIPGALRAARAADRASLVRWTAAFDAELGERDGTDPVATVDAELEGGRLHLWDRDGSVSMATTRLPAAGVARVSLVYTPPQHRGHGYASACVAALSAHVLASDAHTCMLFTELTNPTSNAIYRAIGYEPVAEVLAYRFG